MNTLPEFALILLSGSDLGMSYSVESTPSAMVPQMSLDSLVKLSRSVSKLIVESGPAVTHSPLALHVVTESVLEA